MRIIAPMMILIMLTSTLAGCTGGDPDGGGNDEIDMDVLNSLIDDNLQDFINNTTITVENHYHNNTTIINNDNSQNNITGSSSGVGINGTSNGIIRTIDFVFNLEYLFNSTPIVPGDRTNTYTTIWTYYDYATNSERTDSFTFDCSVYYLVGSANSSNQVTYWENSNYYHDAWVDNGYNNTMRDIFSNLVWEENLRWACDENYYGNENSDDYDDVVVFNFVIPEGHAIYCLYESQRPTLFAKTNSYESDGTQIWQQQEVGSLRVDGMPVTCNNYYYPESFGGEYEMNAVIRMNNLYENTDYRLLYTYKLVEVIPHDITDIED
jgi:hypothetical protein